MTQSHNKKEIMDFLSKESIGILCTYDNKSTSLRQRVMYYGIDGKFDCYLMSTKESPKIAQILSSSNISFLVFGLEETLGLAEL